MSNNTPDSFSNFFLLQNEVHYYPTRSSSAKNIFIPRLNTTLGKHSLRYQGAMIWPQVPYHCVNWTTTYSNKNLNKLLLKTIKIKCQLFVLRCQTLISKFVSFSYCVFYLFRILCVYFLCTFFIGILQFITVIVNKFCQILLLLFRLFANSIHLFCEIL